MKMKSPGSDDLIQRLERLERQIQEASRGSRQRDYAKIYLSNTFTHAGGDRRYQDAWYGIPEVDTTGKPHQNIPGTIVHINEPSPIAGNQPATWFEIPYPGRWRVRFDAGVDIAGGLSTSSHAAVQLRVNDDVDTNFVDKLNYILGAETKLISPPPGAERIAVEVEHLFQRGDHVSFLFYATVANVVKFKGVNEWPKMPTYASIEYMGPQ